MSDDDPIGLGIAVLTVSDTRSEDNDTSGDFLCEAAVASGSQVD